MNVVVVKSYSTIVICILSVVYIVLRRYPTDRRATSICRNINIVSNTRGALFGTFPSQTNPNRPNVPSQASAHPAW